MTIKKTYIIGLVALVLTHAFFVRTVLYTQQPILSISLLITLPAYLLFKKKESTTINWLNITIWTTSYFLGAIGTYLLYSFFGLNVVLSAAICGTFFGLIPGKNDFLRQLKLIAYTGVFSGMTNKVIFQDQYVLPELSAATLVFLLSAITGTVMYLLLRNSFLGLGGKLGTIAFAGSATSLLLYNWIWG